MIEAMYYAKLPSDKVECRLCPHNCIISLGRRGICQVRENRDGKLYSRNYGCCTALGLDPIEKKPLYHFYPGQLIFSIGTFGCNFRCQFCQNWGIAQPGDREPTVEVMSPEEVARRAVEVNSMGIAYTYSEPSVWFEFVLATAKLARGKGLKNVMVSNGFIEPKPLAELSPWIDAWNIDIKGFNEPFYRKIVGGSYEPVLKTAAAAVRAGSHVEITTLLVTGLNDDPGELEDLVMWVATELGPDTPLHFSRYFPQHRLKEPPTPWETIQRAWEIGKKHLRYVYLGNVAAPGGGDTLCPNCGETVIGRSSYRVRLLGLAGSACRACGHKLAIVND